MHCSSTHMDSGLWLDFRNSRWKTNAFYVRFQCVFNANSTRTNRWAVVLLKANHHRPASKTPLTDVALACRWWSNIECWLGSCDFSGDPDLYCWKTLYFLRFSRGVRTHCPSLWIRTCKPPVASAAVRSKVAKVLLLLNHCFLLVPFSCCFFRIRLVLVLYTEYF